MKTMLLLCALLAPLAAQAQDIWRCGADGRSYSATPCSEGRVVAISAGTRPAADVQAAQATAAREARQSEELQRARLQQETRAAGGGLGSLSAARQLPVKPAATVVAKNNRKQLRHRPAADGTSTAIAPASRRTKG